MTLVIKGTIGPEAYVCESGWAQILFNCEFPGPVSLAQRVYFLFPLPPPVEPRSLQVTLLEAPQLGPLEAGEKEDREEGHPEGEVQCLYQGEHFSWNGLGE